VTQPEQLSRRSFMSGAGALIVCVAGSPQSASSQARPRSLAPNPDLDTWLRIERDGRVHVFTGKCELGQGIKTAVAQIVAEELDVQLGRLIVETVDTAHSPNEGGTVGSNSIPTAALH
jgi:nicotinate dehydrogenase subunit B